MDSLAPLHSGQFYDGHEALIDRLGEWCARPPGRQSVSIISTSAHRSQLRKALERLEVDVRNYAPAGRFAMCDAEEMLAMFMVDGFPDTPLFMASLGKLLVA